jgi:CPA2 family monovalent cation:H+ antiporter-2
LLKSFSVPVAAGCVGQHLEALGLIEIGVEVNNVRRGRMQLELDQNLVIEAGDVIVMRGSSEALAIAEELLSGRPA